jgi:hypothetical protein
MKGATAHIIQLFGLLVTLTACSSNEEIYPSVQMDFVTAQTGSKGKITGFITDKGKNYSVSDDRTSTPYNANQTQRIVANYELLTSKNDTTIRVYSSIAAISSVPKKAATFTNGVKTDPAEVLSIWKGLNYLNIVLNILAQDKTHTFSFVEQSVTTDKNGRKNISILLYHDANNDVEDYTKRAYLSIPLQQYAGSDNSGAIITFSLYTYGGIKESYQFDYTPK